MIQSVNLSQKPPKKDSHHLNNFKSTNNFFEFENQCNSNEDFNLEDSDSEINSPLSFNIVKKL